MKLVTIRISHYNEKARWALDRFGVRYVEQPWMPILHMPAVLWATRGRGGRADKVSTKLSTPVLITDEGLRVCDSSSIVQYVSDRFGTPETTLFPPEHRAEIDTLDRYVHDRVGPHARRVIYAAVLDDVGFWRNMAGNNVGPWQARVFGLLRPLAVAAIRRSFRIDAQRTASSREHLRKELATLSERVQGRRYLVGDRFTAADLSVACMLAPVLLPTPEEGYGAVLPAIDEVRPELAEFVREVRATPAGRWALDMFAHERGRRRVPCPTDPARPLLH